MTMSVNSEFEGDATSNFLVSKQVATWFSGVPMLSIYFPNTPFFFFSSLLLQNSLRLKLPNGDDFIGKRFENSVQCAGNSHACSPSLHSHNRWFPLSQRPSHSVISLSLTHYVALFSLFIVIFTFTLILILI
jgi:hypothetical protein